ncbi:glutamyl-Q tRNA(Asp) synthetase [Rhodobacter aestuarii]|uniref:Glutamyl-Q tRNA(Asp) synthetase n=1 Tax=Rhodobacter aestuarii TaxID=453582 RepID=A0A1N7M713_9RHOB|nr:tRNA glutamyl-Q(34) synthetase GluQRS [Rhodobacter aestuarii]PTV94893.1 glutamyl-Q tRNA(Asp) synthetase [Rhodobacter aestuarii]SIS81916.1 glutamyl-Q tRNA(Asp) synthetase [Rhodobacter aestuarii]
MITRFAPSPTGPLHLGHAYAALVAHDMARAAGGAFLLRIEDIDRARSKPEWEAQIYDDLRWLGISWDGEVMRQSDRLPAYRATLEKLWADGLLYACHCTRRDIEAAVTAPQEGAPLGPDGIIYPGTCRLKGAPKPGEPLPKAALRLRMDLAACTCSFEETGPAHRGTHPITPAQMTNTVGDVVLARREMGTSYHLAVVLDDAAQGITHVTRGEDLFEATQIHVTLQQLLGLPVPIYHHHGLIRDDQGKRLAKRDDARALSKYRAEGASPADIRRLVGL